jgi:GGDEF domain-containing protein
MLKKLRYNSGAIFIWFFFLYNLERFGEPLNIATFVYIFAAFSAVFIILVPAFQRIPMYWAFLVALPPYFVLKFALGYQIDVAHLAITVTEVAAIWLTIVLVRDLGKRLALIGETIADLTLGQLTDRTESFEAGQGLIYREIRRARRYRRPATLLAISPEVASLDLTLNRFIQDLQREIIHQYVAVRVARMLMEELHDSDVITRRNSHFVALLPETSREDVDEIICQLEAAAEEKLGLKLKIGLATFPDEAVTFETLLENAEAKMQQAAAEVGEARQSAPTAIKEFQLETK